MKNELRIFFTAVLFYTRIPCPKWVDHSDEYLQKSSRYFPLIGIIVGGFSALVFWSALHVFPSTICIVLSMAASVLMTGAFHEDGWADVCDGFGGGWTKEKILLIMKDSRVGAYGVIGLVLLFLFKFCLLQAVDMTVLPFVVIAAHASSRFMAVSLIHTHSYARDDESSKIKPLAKQLALSDLLIAAVFGLAPILLLQNYYAFLILVPMLLLRAYLGSYFKKWIGGYTGDCLGATQQLEEVLFYLSYLVVWKYT